MRCFAFVLLVACGAQKEPAAMAPLEASLPEGVVAPLDDLPLILSAPATGGVVAVKAGDEDIAAVLVDNQVRAVEHWPAGATLDIRITGLTDAEGRAFPTIAVKRRVHDTRLVRSVGGRATTFFDYDTTGRPVCEQWYEGVLMERAVSPFKANRYAYADNGDVETFLAENPGPDGRFCTADDTGITSYSYERKRDRAYEYGEATAPGADGAWGSDDDEHSYRVTNVTHSSGAEENCYDFGSWTCSCTLPAVTVDGVKRSFTSPETCDVTQATRYCDASPSATICYVASIPGQATPMTDRVSVRTDFTRSERGLLLSSRSVNGEGELLTETKYQYDQRGNRISETWDVVTYYHDITP